MQPHVHLRRVALTCAALGLLTLAAPGSRAAGGKKEPDKDEPRILVEFAEQMTFGLQLLADGRKKKITFDDSGRTNHCFVSIEGKNYVFGVTKADEKFPRQLGKGKWVKEKEALGGGRRGFSSVWQAEDVAVVVTQTVEVVRSATGHLDTCLIIYKIENKDKEARKIGLRAFTDTLIGANDGHPFEVPGQKELVTTSADFRTAKEVPAHVRALESADKGAFAAVFTLKVGGGLEAPDRCSLCRFPIEQDDVLGPTVPVRNIKLDEKDSGDACVILYWSPRELKAGAGRTVGYAYGGGVVTKK